MSDQQSSPDNDTFVPDTEGGANALKALREENKKYRSENARLRQNLEQYGEVSPEQIRKFQDANLDYEKKLAELQKQNEALTGEVGTLQNYREFSDVAREVIDPAYMEFAWDKMKGAIAKTEKGLVVGETPVTDALAKFTEQYPKFAATSSGANQSRSVEGTKEGKIVVTEANFVDNLDAIISGKATVK